MNNSEIAVAPGLAEDDSSVVGTATADQVLERWWGFVETSGRELREKAGSSSVAAAIRGGTAQASWGRLLLSKPPGRSLDDSTITSGRFDIVEVLGLNGGNSSSNSALGVLLKSLREARLCILTAPDVMKPLVCFGEGARPKHQQDDETGLEQQLDSELITELAGLLPDLDRLCDLLERIADLVTHLLQQLLGLHLSTGEAFLGSNVCGPKRPPLPSIMDALMQLLAIPAIADGLFQDCPQLKQAHETFSWIVSKAGSGSSEKLELPLEVATSLSGRLNQAEPLITGFAFSTCMARIEAALEEFNGQGSAAVASQGLKERLVAQLRAQMEAMQAAAAAADTTAAGLTASGGGGWSPHGLLLPAESLIPWASAFVLTCTLWKPGRTETRLAADALKAHRLSPAVPVQGRVAWCLGEFFRAHLPASVAVDGTVRKELEELPAHRQRQALRLDDGRFVAEMQRHSAGVQIWLGSLGASARALQNGGDQSINHALRDAPDLLLRGLRLALRIRSLLEEFLVLHVRAGLPVPRSCLQAVTLGFQLLKALEAGPSSPRWAELTMLLQRRLATELHSELEEARRSRLGRRSAADAQSAQMLKVALEAVYCAVGSVVGQSAFCFEAAILALCCAGGDLESSVRRLAVVGGWRRALSRLCDTSWSYWVRKLFPELLTDLRKRPKGIAALPPLCHAFVTASERLLVARPHAAADLAEELLKAIDSQIIDPVCDDLEQDLRLHTHAVIQASPDGLVAAARPEIVSILGLRPICVAPRAVLNIRTEVELRLGKTFYDLTAIEPQLAETYDRMRLLALERYGLRVLDGRLPAASLDHGLDVIEIMRNVHQFSAQYSYSLHRQLFIQSSNQGEAKVRTIALEHLATSIRTHGAGVVNTSVHYIYGFLKKKLEVIMEFLGDESVRSRMLTDQQWALEERSSGGKGYSWTRAAETASFIRRLGAGADGVYFLDKLRQVVTQIGNTLAYVRMVRTAGMRCVSGSLPYADAAAAPWAGVPIEEDDEARAAEEQDTPEEAAGRESFCRNAKAAACPPLVTDAAEAADEAVRCSQRCFESSTDYLNLLAEVFAKALESFIGTAPARLFHLLVPALSLSFLNSLLLGQQALAKRATTSAVSSLWRNALCFDDGFALGAACILRIFGLEADFQALHWFEAEILEEDLALGGDEDTRHGDIGPWHGPGGQGQLTTETRRELLERERGHLASTFEAAASLFRPQGPGQ